MLYYINMKLSDIARISGIPGFGPGKDQEDQNIQEIDSNRIPPETREIRYEWNGISRVGKPQISQKASKTLFVIGIVVALILIAMQEFVFIIGILSIVFVSYMLSQVPAEQIKYEITNLGITYASEFYRWNEMSSFFFTLRHDSEILAVDLKRGVPARLYLTLIPGDRNKIRDMLRDHVAYLEQEPRTFVDDATDWISSKLNLDPDGDQSGL
jgi:hypothetical protein